MSAAQVALYYDDAGYVETLQRRSDAAPGTPLGLMGRQVAGKEFLDAYLTYGRWDELAALTPNRASGQSLLATCGDHPSSRSRQRRLRLYEIQQFSSQFLSDPPAPVLHFPCPPDVRFAWARQQTPRPPFSLSGVTHTLCSASAVDALRNLLLAPFEPFDCLICTSRAVVQMIENVTQVYADFLRERHGGRPGRRILLEHIPLGVEVDKYRPAKPEQRRAARARFHITDDESAVLFVGRLAHHAKAHPFPMFRALAEAARQSDSKVHLLLAGWASGPAVLQAFQDGAQRFAPGIRVSLVDGTQRENRMAVWQAADIFTSLSDNIQETFGLVLVEAMASGLPVVASDWNGYRDLVSDGETGFLVPTLMIHGASSDLTLQLMVGQIDYDHFLARSNQCVTVDVRSARDAYARLLRDSELRQRFGHAGRRRAEQQFAWSHVIRRYEQLWARLDRERQDWLAAQQPGQRSPAVPAAYAAPEHSFKGYPTRWLGEQHFVVTAEDAPTRLDELLAATLTNYESQVRAAQPQILRSVLDTAFSPCPLAELVEQLVACDHSPTVAKATLAWLMKYDLLRLSE